jgi:hypothetical protein
MLIMAVLCHSVAEAIPLRWDHVGRRSASNATNHLNVLLWRFIGEQLRQYLLYQRRMTRPIAIVILTPRAE